MQKSPILLLGFIALVAGTFLISSCEKKPLVIGFAGPLTGPYADMGVHGRNGAHLALEEINARGGIAGRRLVLLSRDDFGTDEGAFLACEGLIQAGVTAILGHMTSSQSMAALPAAQQASMVLLSPTTSTPELSGIDDMFFRVQPTTDTAARALAAYAAQERQLLHIGTVRDLNNRGFADPFHQAFSEIFQRYGGKISPELTLYSTGAPNWDSLAAQLGEEGFDALLVILAARDAAALAQALHARGIRFPLLSSNWAMTEELFTAGGRTVETIIFAGHTFSEKQSPQYQQFLKNYSKRYGHWPSFAAEYAYDAMRVLAEALERTGGKNRGLPAALLQTQNFAGLHWPISIDPYGDVRSPIYITEVQGGRFRLIRTIHTEQTP
ncbi:ABC transporter substrate-binding protein [Desulfobotulus sp. H1]|uniref:ABC transporter substrate-binding protein n=1 Tax=Desulfobotulus pelophilus TaxID=2823377 RepID=A0ABT3N7R3_9BACT|nr:ABC transporter substrate-binding protein [Desulfobotulus pelophilus]MCW7753077.1 ABC transporter substrate-binding protein [Desulfobotulus pelophilus]